MNLKKLFNILKNSITFILSGFYILAFNIYKKCFYDLISNYNFSVLLKPSYTSTPFECGCLFVYNLFKSIFKRIFMKNL